MADENFEQKVEAWLNDQPSKFQKGIRALKALRHNKRAKGFRIWGVAHGSMKALMASSAPAVAHFAYASISLLQAGAATIAILAGHAVVSVFDRMSKDKKDTGPRAELDLAVRFGEIIGSIDSTSTKGAEADDSIKSALGVIEIIARRVTKAAKGEISVSLAVYNGSSAEELKIRHRNPGNDRPINKKFNGKKVLGHHACRAGTDPRVVNDLRDFGKTGMTSPTQSSMNYRSIFIIPVVRHDNGEEIICGFISIDSTHAYAFYGNRADTIIVTCVPFIEHIQDLL